LNDAKSATKYPIFNSPEETVRALAAQRDWHARKALPSYTLRLSLTEKDSLQGWIAAHTGDIGEESLDFLHLADVPVAASAPAKDEQQAVELAPEIGYPLVMKVSSPDALHKTEAGGVIIGVTGCFAEREG